jgi:hypothetical protein
MTTYEAAVVTAYTGILCVEFTHFHKYAETLLGRPVFTHEFGSQGVADLLKEKSRADFIALPVGDL